MIHVVVGPPCSGKSTFVKETAPPGVPRFDFDLVASAVAGMDVGHDSPQPVIDTVLAMRRGLMGWALDSETVVDELWVINANPSAATIERFQAAGAQFHVIDPGLEECIARAQREGRPDHTIDRIKAWYDAPPSIPESKGGEPMKSKDFEVQVKAAGDDGEFTAYASVFDTVDSYGDVTRKGAFAESLAEWKESGNTIPVLYGHDFKDPFSNIGAVTEAVEDDHGLKVTAKLDMDNPKAAQVYKLMKAKRLSQMSFAYDVKDAEWVTVDGRDVYELTRLKLYEVSVVPIGANQETEILAMKSAHAALSKDAHVPAECTELLAKALAMLPDASESKAPPGDAESKNEPPQENPAGVLSCGEKAADEGERRSVLAELLILEGDN